MTNTPASSAMFDRELLLKDPEKFYGKKGNWFSRIFFAVLRWIS